MTLLYHASPITGLDTIVPMKDAKHDVPVRGDNPKYACYTNSPTVAFWWASHLSLSRQEKVWYIYEVELPPFVEVELCVNHFHFERRGRFTMNKELIRNAPITYDSGEINVYEPLPVKKVFAKVVF